MRKNKPRAGIAFYLGIIIFFYLSFDLVNNNYTWQESVIKVVLAGLALILPIMGKIIFKK